MERKSGFAMVAPHVKPDGKIHPVEELAAEAGMSAAELAGLRRSTGWALGKQVSTGEFNEAVDKFLSRPMGSGRL